MSLPPLLLLQAVANLPPIAFDLAKVTTARPAASRCAAGAGAEIVVCGKTDASRSFRVAGGPGVVGVLPRAEFRLFGKTSLAAQTEQASLGGIPSNRMMVRMKIPF